MTVYFVRRNVDADGLVKIGFTADMPTRMSILGTSNPEGFNILCTVPGGRDLECYLHTAFESDRVSGEWFRPSRDLDRLIGILKTQGLAGLPAGVCDLDEDPEQDADVSDLGDVLLASRMIKRAAAPSQIGDSVKAQILRASRRLRLSYTRTKDIWYGGARKIAAWEMRKLFAAANETFVASAEQQELSELRKRVHELENLVSGALDRPGTTGGR